jgi:hypothetical protein
LIETVSANLPRFDYDPVTGECRGLLIEEQRTNLVTNSTGPTFTGLTGISTTTDGTQAPDGSNAIVYIPTTGATYHASNANFCTIDLDAVGIATGATYDVTYSMWIKDYNSSDLGVYFVTQADISGTSASYALRLAKPKSASWIVGGLLAGWTRNYEKVVPYPNGWYRFIQSYRYTRQTSYNRLAFYIQVYNNRNVQTYRGDGTSGIYIWGPQVETAVSPSQAPFETSYIPTSGSTVTRSVDNASMTGTNFSSWYNSIEGTLYANAKSNANTLNNQITGIAALNNSSSPTTYRVDLRYYQGGNSYTFFNGVGGGGSSIARTSGFSLTNPKFIVSYASQNVNFCVNSSLISSRASAFIPSPLVNTLRIGTFDSGTSFYLNGTISRLTYYPKALSPSQLQYLTQ